MNGLRETAALNAFAASLGGKAVAVSQRTPGMKSRSTRESQWFRLRERGGKTFCLYDDGTESELGK